MLREVMATQRRVRVLAFKSVTAALTEGKFDGTIVKNSTGNYTITFTKAFARAPVVVGLTSTALTTMIRSTVAVGSVIITTVGADQSTATDADFEVLVWGFDTADAT